MQTAGEPDGGLADLDVAARPESRAWGRIDWVCLLLLLVVLGGSLPLLVHGWYDHVNDSGIYLETARALAAGEGYSRLGEPFLLRPPGFALLLAPIIWLRGYDFALLNAFVLLFIHQRPSIGPLLALAVALTLWSSPFYERLCNVLMSDVPGLASVLLCLVVERWATRRQSFRREALLGVLIGLASYVRFASILLVPAILCARIARHATARGASWRTLVVRRLIPFSVLALLVVLPWNLRNRVVAPEPPAVLTYYYSYSTAMWHSDGGDPTSPRVAFGELLERPLARVPQLIRSLGSRMNASVEDQSFSASDIGADEAAFAVLLLLGLVLNLARRRGAAEFWTAGLLVLMIFSFGLRDRQALPIFVLALCATLDVSRRLLIRWAGPRAGTALCVTALGALAVIDMDPRGSWPEIQQEHEARLEECARIARQLEPGARIGAGHDRYLGVLLERPVVPLYFAVRRAGNRVRAVEELIDRYRLDTVIVSLDDETELSLLKYFTRTYGPGRPAGSWLLWRVRD